MAANDYGMDWEVSDLVRAAGDELRSLQSAVLAHKLGEALQMGLPAADVGRLNSYLQYSLGMDSMRGLHTDLTAALANDR